MLKKILYVLVQCTWGILQSLAGYCYMLKFWNYRHEWYHGSFVTYFDAWGGGLSLGMFTFVSEMNDEMKKVFEDRGDILTKQGQRALLVHEYGHTIQSLMLGPLYLFVVGAPSMIWGKSKRLLKMREETGRTYESFWCEQWANDLGEWVTGESAWHK